MSLPLPLREGEGRGGVGSPSAPSPRPPYPGLTQAELRMLLIDCLELWGVEGRIDVNDDAFEVATRDATLRVQRAPPDMLPVRWLLHRSPSRPPRVAPSIVALLTALRNALGVEGTNRLRIGASA